MRTKRSVAQPAGFTLLETLLATALCTVLLAATWATTDLYWNYRVRSQDRLAFASLSQAVVADLESDLRMVLPAPPRIPEALDPEQTTADDRFRQLITEDEFRERLFQLQPVGTVNPVRFAGGADWLLLLTDHDSIRFPAGDVTRRLRQVVWTFAGPSQTVPVSGQGETIRTVTLPVAEQHGLNRWVIPVTAAPESANIDHSDANLHITAVAFRYYDGSEWRTDWTGPLMMALPQAVEIQLQFSGEGVNPLTTVVWLSQGTALLSEEQP